MPLNTLRLNHAPSSHPNERIVFIKPLPRPPSLVTDYETADTLLRAIAAQCLPIMKSHYLSVTTLEEHEHNREFIGRNFNNGEIIQLVLRGKNGGWLPVNMIQMVMMHELAHNVHMNHSRKFWETRNLYAEEMRALWSKGYTGEGFWGGGRMLSQLGHAMSGNTLRSEELKDLPVCGGTFRSRGRKRKSKNDGLTWREKKDKRIEKKFGKNGVSLGEDEDKRLSLDLAAKGPIGVKPRVAQSKRGRELRVAAALARFETNKKEVKELDSVKPEEDTLQSEDEYEDADADQEDARDTNGRKLLDSQGRGMVKICEEEDRDDVQVKREMEELNDLEYGLFTSNDIPSRTIPITTNKSARTKPSAAPRSLYDIPQHQDKPSQALPPISPSSNTSPTAQPVSKPIPKPNPKPNTVSKPQITIHTRPRAPTSTTSSSSAPTNQPISTSKPDAKTTPSLPTHITTTAAPPPKQSHTTTCPICSLINSSQNPTCTTCGHVLDSRKDPRAWKCTSETCPSGSKYLNAGDMGVCFMCGERKAG